MANVCNAADKAVHNETTIWYQMVAKVVIVCVFRQKEFFAGAAKMTGQQREEEYNKIKKDYTKASNMYNLKKAINKYSICASKSIR
jgi:hypothetical protein